MKVRIVSFWGFLLEDAMIDLYDDEGIRMNFGGNLKGYKESKTVVKKNQRKLKRIKEIKLNQRKLWIKKNPRY